MWAMIIRGFAVGRAWLLAILILGLSGTVLSAQTKAGSEPLIGGGNIVFDDGEEGPTSTDSTAARILENHLRFRGGTTDLAEATRQLKMVRSLLLRGTLKEGNSEFQITLYRQAPNRFREERFRRHLGWEYLTLRGTDGQTAWSQEVKPKPQPALVLEEAESANVLLEADFYGPLIDYAEKGHHFAYQGEVKISGQPAFLVKGRLKGGEIRYYYFHTRKFYLIAYGFKETFAGQPVDADIYPTKMERIAGVMFETAWTYRSGGDRYRTVTFTEIQPNPAFTSALFALPVSKERWLRGENALPEGGPATP